jgi:long-chain fatty acid transport protein
MTCHIQRSLFTTLLLVAAGSSAQVWGAGFALNEQNASELGRAMAGRASSAANAATVFGNPAGMARLQRAEISGGVAYIQATSDIDHVSGSLPGTNEGDMVPETFIPFGYYVHPLDERWHIGIGLYSPYGLVTDYEDGFQGRYLGTKSELKMITVQPTVSYRFNPQWSAGIGVTYNDVRGELSRAVANPFSPGSNDGLARVKGDDDGWGYNVGVLFELSERTRFGLTYHSEVDFTLDGHTRLTNIPLLGNANYAASLDLTLPDTYDLSATHEFGNGWTLHAGVVRTGWSSFDKLEIINSGAPAALTTVVEQEGWHDTWSYALGAAYRLNPQWQLQAGVALDESPIPNEHRSVRVPSDDRTIYALGATWSPNRQLSVDFAYAYLREPDTTVDQPGYRAEFRNRAQALAIQLNWKI